MIDDGYMKFQGFSTATLVKAIQETHIKMLGLNGEKKLTGTKVRQTAREINDMRKELISRLNSMDRYKASFFPVGSYVTVHPNEMSAPKNAIVVEHVNDYDVVVKIEGEIYPVHVPPMVLQLKFIRYNFY